MSVAPDLRVEAKMVNGTPYVEAILARSGLAGYWRLGESSGTVAVDASGNVHHGTYVDSPSLGADAAIRGSDTAVEFNGTSQYVDMGAVASLGFTSAFSVEAWVKYASNAGQKGRVIVGKMNYGAGRGWGMWVNGTDAFPVPATAINGIRLRAHDASLAVILDIQSADALEVDVWHHVVVTWSGTTAANGIKMYVDGVLNNQATATGTAIGTTSNPFRIGYVGTPESNQFFNGSIDEVSVYSRELTPAEAVEAYELRNTGAWVDITDDVELDGGLHIHRGIQGNGPTNLVAGGGSLSLTLDNSDRNSAGLAGLYSPHHANCLDGWEFDIPIRVTFIYGSPERVHFTGIVRVIDPEPGIYGAQRVRVEAYDLMRDLIDMDIREIDIAVDQSEDQVISAVLDLLPDDAMPESRDLDAGVDVFPYVFDKIGPATAMASPISDAVVSSFGLFAVKGDGTPMFRNRQSLAVGTSAYTFDELRRVVIPSTLDSVYTVVRATGHPKTIDPAATSVLYALEGTAPAILPGATLTIWGDYRDTTDDRTLIGGLDRVVPLVASTDYLGNSAEDGSGTDVTSSLSLVTSDFAATAKFEITNTSLATVYLTMLQIRGKRVLDIGAQTAQSGEETGRRIRPLDIDLPLQANPNVVQSAADYVRYLYSDERQQVNEIEYLANYSEALLTQFMTREIGDRISATEEQTGLDDVNALILSIDIEVGDAMTVICRYGLAPANTLQVWQLGVAGASELGVTTVLGF